MYTRDICIADVFVEFERNHQNLYKKYVKQAYGLAVNSYKEDKSRTGEPFIMHILRIARFIASWGFESDTLCATFLYAAVAKGYVTIEEISKDYGDGVVRIIESVNSFYDVFFDLSLDAQSRFDLLVQDKYLEKALYIKAAARIDELYTIDSFSDSEKHEIVEQTRGILLDMLKKEEAYSVINHLEDLCLEIDDPELYSKIEQKVDELCIANSYTTTKVLDYFDSLFLENDINLPEECRSYLGYVSLFKSNRRSIVSFYRQIASQANNIEDDLPRLLNKSNIALYDLTLVVCDRDKSKRLTDLPKDLTPFDVFFKFYEYALSKMGICIIDSRKTYYNDSHYFLLKDNMENMYRIFVKSESQYMQFRIGQVADHISFYKTPSSLKGKIKVFTASGEARYIDAGATMLDFAFMIHSEVGFHFDHAVVGNVNRKHYDRLSPGDRVVIHTNPNVVPDMKWFKYVKTENATENLIRMMNSLMVMKE